MLSNSDSTSNRIYFPHSHLLRKNLDCMAHRESWLLASQLFYTTKHPLRLGFLENELIGAFFPHYFKK